MATQERPIILFIHGAWHVPLHYRHLIDALRSRGLTVLAPTLLTTGYGDSVDGKTHLDDAVHIRQFLLPYLEQGRKVVVVAHSYGGIVATEVAGGLTLKERRSRGQKGGIISVVYIAALLEPSDALPPPGQAMPPFPPGWTNGNIRPLHEDVARVVLYNDIEKSRQDEALRMLVWQSELCYVPAATYKASDIQATKTYVACKKDMIIPLERQYQRAKIAGATIQELDCGHSPFLLEKKTASLVEIIINTATVAMQADAYEQAEEQRRLRERSYTIYLLGFLEFLHIKAFSALGTQARGPAKGLGLKPRSEAKGLPPV
ncbi:Alpha/Beta hydrolase protein [Hypoxylon sp. NC1633]|nr:Alpha/Beta hydrolase protein [Hypoxylon sp. NC1633]